MCSNTGIAAACTVLRAHAVLVAHPSTARNAVAMWAASRAVTSAPISAVSAVTVTRMTVIPAPSSASTGSTVVAGVLTVVVGTASKATVGAAVLAVTG